MTDTAIKTPLSDSVAAALDAMRLGGSTLVTDIPDDSSYSSYKFTGDVSKEIARRADLAAVPAQVRVKPLVWTRYASEDFEAASPLGLYRCIRTLFDTSVLWLDGKKLGIYGGGSHDEAKGAAQAHYEANALEPQPDPRDEVIARLVEAADECRQALKDYMKQYPHMVKGYLVDAEQHARAALEAAKALQK